LEKILKTRVNRIILVADSFPPFRNSAAVLVFSLAEAFSKNGCTVLVIIPSYDIDKPYIEECYEKFKVLRINCGNIKSQIKLLRGLSELLLFFSLPIKFKKTKYSMNTWDAVIWYSPTIFLSGIVRLLKKKSSYSYLILRDIVPDWMVDIGIIKKGPSFYLLKWFEIYQYRLADVIGVQSSGNLGYIKKLYLPNLKKLEVLPNWMPSVSEPLINQNQKKDFIDLQKTVLAGKKVLIYAGNLGEAQGLESFSKVLLEMKDSPDIGFLIIGRGSKKSALQKIIGANKLTNVLMLDEMDLSTLSMLYCQCHAGLVFLNYCHKSHNIPGKFISYLEAGLPIIASVNPGNDLIDIVNGEGLGFATDVSNSLAEKISNFINDANNLIAYGARSRAYYENNHRPNLIVEKISRSLKI
jgi:glycosyltransferase involved in cell wall biosynthesis